MKHRGMALLLAAATLFGAQAAMAQNSTYVFPYEGFRYTQYDGETILTQTNLADNEALLSSLGTTSEAMLANYVASGTVMEIIPAEGGQISISVLDAGEFAEPGEMSEMTDEQLRAFIESFVESGMYDDCSLVNVQPLCARFTSSAMYGSMPVYTLRYATLHLGKLYMLSETIIGREPAEADDAQMVRVLGGMKLLSTLPEPTATPTAQPTATPEPTPMPTPGVAAELSSEGELTVEGVPAYTTEEELAISGTAAAGEKVTVSVGGKELGTATVKSDGSYALRVKLPEVGALKLIVSTGSARKELSLVYDLAFAPLTITEPVERVFTVNNTAIRGITAPEANVWIESEDGRISVKANKQGLFTAHISFKNPGTLDYVVHAKAKGYQEATQTVTLTREMTERERLGAFRQKMINLKYSDFVAAPEKYIGKGFTTRGHVEEFTDYDGLPCALITTDNVSVGVWKDPMWVVLDGTEGLNVGDNATFYLTVEGTTLPAEGKYTRGGTAIEAPVSRKAFFSK